MFELFLRNLLIETEKKHREHERDQFIIKPDDWAKWYAGHMAPLVKTWLDQNANMLDEFCGDEPDDSTESSMCEK